MDKENYVPKKPTWTIKKWLVDALQMDNRYTYSVYRDDFKLKSFSSKEQAEKFIQKQK